jgi:hypothetical protein
MTPTTSIIATTIPTMDWGAEISLVCGGWNPRVEQPDSIQAGYLSATTLSQPRYPQRGQDVHSHNVLWHVTKEEEQQQQDNVVVEVERQQPQQQHGVSSSSGIPPSSPPHALLPSMISKEETLELVRLFEFERNHCQTYYQRHHPSSSSLHVEEDHEENEDLVGDEVTNEEEEEEEGPLRTVILPPPTVVHAPPSLDITEDVDESVSYPPHPIRPRRLYPDDDEEQQQQQPRPPSQRGQPSRPPPGQEVEEDETNYAQEEESMARVTTGTSTAATAVAAAATVASYPTSTTTTTTTTTPSSVQKPPSVLGVPPNHSTSDNDREDEVEDHQVAQEEEEEELEDDPGPPSILPKIRAKTIPIHAVANVCDNGFCFLYSPEHLQGGTTHYEGAHAHVSFYFWTLEGIMYFQALVLPFCLGIPIVQDDDPIQWETHTQASPLQCLYDTYSARWGCIKYYMATAADVKEGRALDLERFCRYVTDHEDHTVVQQQVILPTTVPEVIPDRTLPELPHLLRRGGQDLRSSLSPAASQQQQQTQPNTVEDDALAPNMTLTTMTAAAIEGDHDDNDNDDDATLATPTTTTLLIYIQVCKVRHPIRRSEPNFPLDKTRIWEFVLC